MLGFQKKFDVLERLLAKERKLVHVEVQQSEVTYYKTRCDIWLASHSIRGMAFIPSLISIIPKWVENFEDG